MNGDSPCPAPFVINDHAHPPRSPVLRGRRDHPCVCFLQEVFNRCIRLGIYEEFVDLLPEDFTSIVPPEPTFQFKYSSDVDSELRRI